MNFLQNLILLVTIFSTSRANIWDSLFTDTPSPFMVMPPDFEVILSTSTYVIPYKIIVDYSSTFNQISIKDQVEFFGVPINNAYVIMNLDQNAFYAHSKFNSCIWMSNEEQKIKIDLSKIKLLWEFAANYVSTTQQGLSMYNISDLLRFANINSNIYLFFDADQKLDKVDFEWQGQVITFDVDSFLEKEFTNSDFQVPKNWNCNDATRITAKDLQSKNFWDLIMNNIDKFKPPM